LTRREKIFWLIVGAIFVIGFIFLIPAYGQICEQNKDGSQGDCPRYHVALVAIWHIAKFLDDHNGVMIAIATGVVAWFTFSLRQSTDKLWDAGERQLDLLAKTSTAQSRDMQASIAVAHNPLTPPKLKLRSWLQLKDQCRWSIKSSSPNMPKYLAKSLSLISCHRGRSHPIAESSSPSKTKVAPFSEL
jgi:hypothetical protein